VTARSTATIQSALLEKFSSNTRSSSEKGERLYWRPEKTEKGQLTPESALSAPNPGSVALGRDIRGVRAHLYR
jgi:hypothetical protein